MPSIYPFYCPHNATCVHQVDQEIPSPNGQVAKAPILNVPTAGPLGDILPNACQQQMNNASIGVTGPSLSQDNPTSASRAIHVVGAESQPLHSPGASPGVSHLPWTSNIRRELASLRAEVAGLRGVAADMTGRNEPPPAYV